MGLSASVPILLRDLDVSYTDLGTFALCSWPFAIKLLWAPIVDSVYNPKWGRRKTWFVPTQLVAGALFIWAGMPENVDTMMGANGAAPDIPMLTATFFMMCRMRFSSCVSPAHAAKHFTRQALAHFCIARLPIIALFFPS